MLWMHIGEFSGVVRMFWEKMQEFGKFMELEGQEYAIEEGGADERRLLGRAREEWSFSGEEE